MALRYTQIGEANNVTTIVKGTLAEIVASVQVPGTIGLPDDMAGGRLEYKGGRWNGSIGTVSVLPSAAGYADGSTAWVGATQYVVSGGAWVLSAPAKTIQRPIRIAVFGDSTAASAWAGTSDCAVDHLIPTMPGSGNLALGPRGTMMCQLSFQSSVICGSGGISGQTTQQFVDRSKLAYSATRKSLADVLATKPDVVIVHGGSPNDWATMSAATPQATIDAAVSRHTECVKYFTRAGIPVIDPGTLGYSVPGPNLSAIQGIISSTNATYKVAAINDPLWHFVDVSGTLSDGGAFLPGVSDDNIHPNYYGSYLLGQLEHAVLSRLFAPGSMSDSVIFDQQSDFANGASGTPANTVFDTAGISFVSKTLFADRVELVVDVTTTPNYLAMTLLGANATRAMAGVSANDSLLLEYAVSIEDANNVAVPFIVSGVTVDIFNSGNTADVSYNYGGPIIAGSRVLQFCSPISVGAMGSNTKISVGTGFGNIFPRLGRYKVTFSPIRIRKRVP